MTLPFDHTHDLDFGVSRSGSEIALSEEWDGQLTWNEKDVRHSTTMEPCVVWKFPSPPTGDLDCRDC